MKKILFVISLLIFTACIKPKEIVYLKLQNRNGIHYEINQKKPFAGIAKEYYINGQLKREGSYKKGQLNEVKEYYENGIRKSSQSYEDGQIKTIWYFSENGQQESISRYNLGYLTGRTLFHYNNGEHTGYTFYDYSISGKIERESYQAK